jgi:hypothetical protein
MGVEDNFALDGAPETVIAVVQETKQTELRVATKVFSARPGVGPESWVDIRRWAVKRSGQDLPMKKGITLRRSVIPSLLVAIVKAMDPADFTDEQVAELERQAVRLRAD